MKKRLLLLSLLLVCTSLVAKGQRYAVDRQIDGFNGSVKISTQKLYLADVVDGKMQHGTLLEHLKTEYNSRGHRRNMTFLSGEGENVIFRTRYKHDGFGLTTLEHILDPEENIIGRTYYVYDANNILSETYVEDMERQVESRTTVKYDAQGRPSQRSYNDQFNNIYKREVYTYGSDGNILKTVVYDSDGRKMQEWRYEYDSHNQPVSRTLYDYSEGEAEMTVSLFQYRYDNNGNWIQRVEYDVDGANVTPTYITERYIEYFN